MILTIQSYTRISNYTLIINGNDVFASPESESYTSVLTAIYRHLQVQYPKFFKMDNLSKTGFLSVEALFNKKNEEAALDGSNTPVFLICKSSSLETDCNYQLTLAEGNIPSPSLFVYTLPNILLGELAIRFKLFSENTCFVSENYLNENVFDYICQSCLTSDIQKAIVLFADQYGNNGEVLALLVEKTNNNMYEGLVFDIETIKSLIK